jgi:hypothetical protein
MSSAAHSFQELARVWKEATLYSSSTTELASHPAYKEIIGLGIDALPHIFAQLRKQPDHWFAALQAITGEDPVSEPDRGRIDRMTAAWLKWANEHGY